MVDISVKIEDILRTDKRYKEDAYIFVLEALAYTASKLKNPGHVSGAELLNGIKKYVQQQYGPMARSVLEHWGISCTEDFGHIVFNLVDAKILSRTEKDSLEDFKNIYDFKDAFE